MNAGSIRFRLLVAAVGVILIPNVLFADKLCVRNSVRAKNNKVSLAQAITFVSTTCPRGTKELLDTSGFGGGVVTPLTNDNKVVGFARFDAAGAVQNFGGTGATGVQVTRTIPGVYDLTFAGNFPELSGANTAANRNLLSFLSTSVGSTFGVSSVLVTSANSAEIVVRCFTWRSPTATFVDAGGASIAILIGQVP